MPSGSMTYADWKATAETHDLIDFDEDGEIRAFLETIDDPGGIAQVIVLGKEKSWVGIRHHETGPSTYFVLAGRHIGDRLELEDALMALWQGFAEGAQNCPR